MAEVPPSEDPRRLMISPDRLHAHVEALRAAEVEFVTVADLGQRLASQSPLRGVVALTFDDALLNVLDPLLALAEEGVPTTVYAVTDWIGERHPSISDPDQAMVLNPAQLRTLADAGVEIGAHTVNHPDLSTLSFDECLRELRDSRENLESVTGQPVVTLAYPFGRYSDAARRAAKQAGFEVAVALETGLGWEPLAMSRALMGRGESWLAFTLKATGQWPRFAETGPGAFARAAFNRLRGRV